MGHARNQRRQAKRRAGSAAPVVSMKAARWMLPEGSGPVLVTFPETMTQADELALAALLAKLSKDIFDKFETP